MRLTIAIAGAVLAALSLAPATATAAPENPDMSPMIIGGGYASNFPYAARLFFNGRENCSATKIAPHVDPDRRALRRGQRHVHVPRRQPGPDRPVASSSRVRGSSSTRRPTWRWCRSPRRCRLRSRRSASTQRRRGHRPDRAALRLGRHLHQPAGDQLPVALPEGREHAGHEPSTAPTTAVASRSPSSASTASRPVVTPAARCSPGRSPGRRRVDVGPRDAVQLHPHHHATAPGSPPYAGV